MSSTMTNLYDLGLWRRGKANPGLCPDAKPRWTRFNRECLRAHLREARKPRGEVLLDIPIGDPPNTEKIADRPGKPPEQVITDRTKSNRLNFCPRS